MKKILITGNGFERYHKLPVSPEDFFFFEENWDAFYDLYLDRDRPEGIKAAAAKTIQNLLEGEKRVEIRLTKEGDLCYDSMEDFANYPDQLNEKRIEFLNRWLPNNAWIEYFRVLDEPVKTWADCEQTIEDALMLVHSFYTKEIFRGKEGQEELSTPLVVSVRVRNLMDAFGNRAGKRFINYIGRVMTRNDLDKVSLRNQETMLLSCMYRELSLFQKCLNYYLTDFVSLIPFDVYSRQIEKLGKIYHLNFAFTYTYYRVYGRGNCLECHFPYGENSYPGLVIGIETDPDSEEEAFLLSGAYLPFQKSYQRVLYETGFKYKNWIPDIDKENMEEIEHAEIHVFGYSFCRSDERILRELIAAECVDRMVIYYRDQKEREYFLCRLFEMYGAESVLRVMEEEFLLFEKITAPVQRKR